MTRRGSLAYYFAAIVCGCFFIAAAYYAHSVSVYGASERWARDFFFAYFLVVLAGFLPALLYAFLLRRVTRLCGCRAWWQWMACGAALGWGVLWVVTRIGYLIEATRFSAEMQGFKSGVMFLFVGPMMFSVKPFWIPLIAFAATAWVLHRIQSAFDSAVQQQQVSGES
ncbi:MAG TPA: hypothetical protein VGA40_06755 [Candidatus Acidoferrales bacterium]